MSRVKELFSNLFGMRKVIRKALKESSAEDLVAELEEVKIKKQRTMQYLEELKVREAAYKQYEHLDAETIKKISGLAQQAKDIEEKKTHLKGRLVTNNAALNRVSSYEEEIPDLIKEMQVAEKRRRETEAHMLYLQEEKAALIEERETLIAGYAWLKGFSVVMVMVLGVCILVSFILLQILREKIWFVLSGVVAVMMCLIIVVLLIKEKIEKAIRENGILQQKAAKYLNKTKIRFFNQTQYLSFQYHKLGVDSVAKLEMYYNRYLKNKNNEKVYLKMNEKLQQIEEEMLALLSEKDFLIEEMGELSQWILQPKGINEHKQIVAERQRAEDQLKGLEAYIEEIQQDIDTFVSQENGVDKIHQDA